MVSHIYWGLDKRKLLMLALLQITFFLLGWYGWLCNLPQCRRADLDQGLACPAERLDPAQEQVTWPEMAQRIGQHQNCAGLSLPSRAPSSAALSTAVLMPGLLFLRIGWIPTARESISSLSSGGSVGWQNFETPWTKWLLEVPFQPYIFLCVCIWLHFCCFYDL